LQHLSAFIVEVSFGSLNHLLSNKSPGSTQPSIPLCEVNRALDCLAGVKEGCVHLGRVEGNTV